MAPGKGASVMTWISRIRSWPLLWKVPLLVACLMVGIAMMISQVVLSRLASDQENNLRMLTNAYLDGISAAVIQPVIRADVWETFDALDRARNHYSGVEAKFVIVELPDHKVLAASEPVRFPVRSALPGEISEHFAVNDGLSIDSDTGRAWLSRSLQVEGHTVGRILAEIDIAQLLQVRRHVLWTLILVNSGLTLAFAAIGYFALQRMLRPLTVLTNYFERVREGRAEPIPESNQYKIAAEFRRLFARFNAMARALNEREALASRLAYQEKYAVLGKLASGMAHEVNNPLGGIFNALDTLRRHGSDSNVRETTLNLLHRGLAHIRNVVRSTLVTYKPENAGQSLGPADIDDLRVLVEPEAVRRKVGLDWTNELRDRLPVAAGSVRQATLNLLLNACAASPSGGRVSFRAGVESDGLVVEICDDGPGLPLALADYLVDEEERGALPGDGLGLWIVRRLVRNERGSIRVDRLEAHRTLVRVAWPLRADRAARNLGEMPTGEELLHVE
jgi:signal transduction histidine kinase